ncbi:MAG TPA: hypothetical protein VG733_03025 [Chthoniobacteraceae bacterium]|nr:hypothetical protein [Chthoniobacteraceae bacterium]
MQSSHTRRSLFNYAGIAILMLGLATGEFIYWRATQNDDPDIAGTKSYELQVEENTGVFGIITAEIDRVFTDPKAMAVAIWVISAAAAGGCFLVASRMPRE